MKKMKMLEVCNCRLHCYFYHSGRIPGGYCAKASRARDTLSDEIPDWCPLPDASQQPVEGGLAKSIRSVQVKTGEQAVLENLKKLGL